MTGYNHGSPSGNGDAANWADVGRAITQGIVDGLADQPPSRAERRHPPKAPAVCPSCGYAAPDHRFGCYLEWQD